MELFKYVLFGVAGFSMIFWVCVIALWHTYMFPKIFKEDYTNNSSGELQTSQSKLIKDSGLIDRGIYSNKSYVIANFNRVESDYSVNRLSTLILFSLAIMSFIIITYGLHSGFQLYGIK